MTVKAVKSLTYEWLEVVCEIIEKDEILVQDKDGNQYIISVYDTLDYFEDEPPMLAK